MALWRYKCVAAPRRPKLTREHRVPADALAAAMQAAIEAETAAGWEYLRTDLVPMEAKTGWFGPVAETHQAVLVFRRPGVAVAEPDWDSPRNPGADRGAEFPRLGGARGD